MSQFIDGKRTESATGDGDAGPLIWIAHRDKVIGVLAADPGMCIGDSAMSDSAPAASGFKAATPWKSPATSRRRIRAQCIRLRENHGEVCVQPVRLGSRSISPPELAQSCAAPRP